jgi:hypothetical protein
MARFQLLFERFLPSLSGARSQPFSGSKFEAQWGVKIRDADNALGQQSGCVLKRVGVGGPGAYRNSEERNKNQSGVVSAEGRSFGYG